MNGDNLVSCPFNPAHRVAPNKLHSHITKCKKNVANISDFAVCAFSIFHYIPKEKLMEHEKNCPQRSVVDSQVYAGPANFPTTSFSTNEVRVNCHESWDDIDTGPIFKPEERRENAPYMVLPEGMSKSKRKLHKHNERDRLREQECAKKKPSELPAPQPCTSEPEYRKPAGPGKLTGSRIVANLSGNKPESPAGVKNVSPPALTVGRGRGALLGMNQDNHEPNTIRYDMDKDFPKLGK